MATPNPICPSFNVWRGVSARNSQRAQESAKTPRFTPRSNVYVPKDLQDLLEPRARSFGPGDLEAAVVAIKANDKLQWLGAVSAVRKLLSTATQPPSDEVLAAAKAALPRLVLFMGMWDSPNLQLEAARAVGHLVWSGGAEHCAAVVAAGALPAAVALLQPEEDEDWDPEGAAELREQAARLLGNVASYGAGPRDACVEAGVLPAFLSAAARCLHPSHGSVAGSPRGCGGHGMGEGRRPHRLRTPLSPTGPYQQQQQQLLLARPVPAVSAQQQQQQLLQLPRAPSPLFPPLQQQQQQQLSPQQQQLQQLLQRPLSALQQSRTAACSSPLPPPSPPPSPASSQQQQHPLSSSRRPLTARQGQLGSQAPTPSVPALPSQQQSQQQRAGRPASATPQPQSRAPIPPPLSLLHLQASQPPSRPPALSLRAAASPSPSSTPSSSPFPSPLALPLTPRGAAARVPLPMRQLARLAHVLLSFKPRSCAVSRELLPALCQLLLLSSSPHYCHHFRHRYLQRQRQQQHPRDSRRGSCGGNNHPATIEEEEEDTDSHGAAEESADRDSEPEGDEGWRQLGTARLWGLRGGAAGALPGAVVVRSRCDLMAAIALAAEDCPEGVVAAAVADGVVEAAVAALPLLPLQLLSPTGLDSSRTESGSGSSECASASGSSNGSSSNGSSSNGSSSNGSTWSGGRTAGGSSSSGSRAGGGGGSSNRSVCSGRVSGCGAASAEVGGGGSSSESVYFWELSCQAAHLLATLGGTAGQSTIQAILDSGVLVGSFKQLLGQFLEQPGPAEHEQQEGQEQQHAGLEERHVDPEGDEGDGKECTALTGVAAVVREVCAALANIAAAGTLSQAAALVQADLLTPLVRLLGGACEPAAEQAKPSTIQHQQQRHHQQQLNQQQPHRAYPLEVQRWAALALSSLAAKDGSLAEAVHSAAAPAPLAAFLAQRAPSCDVADVRAVVAVAEALLAMAQAGASSSVDNSFAEDEDEDEDDIDSSENCEGDEDVVARDLVAHYHPHHHHVYGGTKSTQPYGNNIRYGSCSTFTSSYNNSSVSLGIRDNNDKDSSHGGGNPVLLSYMQLQEAGPQQQRQQQQQQQQQHGNTGSSVYDSLKLALSRGLVPRAAQKVELLMSWM